VAGGSIQQGETIGATRQNGGPISVGERPRWWRRVSFWRAAAGMTAAAALGAMIIAAEFSGTLVSRTKTLRGKIASLNSSLRHLRHQMTSTERELTRARSGASAGEQFKRILFAPDLRRVKMGSPDGAASAEVVMSESEGAAILRANGLTPSGEVSIYRLWWLPRKGTALLAAEFTVGADGTATVNAALPPKPTAPPYAVVTLEPLAQTGKPSGSVAMTSIRGQHRDDRGAHQ
jgi:hypothetical protein